MGRKYTEYDDEIQFYITDYKMIEKSTCFHKKNMLICVSDIKKILASVLGGLKFVSCLFSIYRPFTVASYNRFAGTDKVTQ